MLHINTWIKIISPAQKSVTANCSVQNLTFQMKQHKLQEQNVLFVIALILLM